MYPSFRFEACWYKWTENKFENNVWISPFLVSAPRRKEKQKPDEIVNEERSEWKYFGALKVLVRWEMLDRDRSWGLLIPSNYEFRIYGLHNLQSVRI